MSAIQLKDSILSRLRRGTLEAFILKGSSVGLIFLMHSTLARTLNAEAYGIFSYALAIAELLAILVPLGLPNALLRFIAEYQLRREWQLLRGLLRRAHQITLISSLLVGALLVGATRLLSVSAGFATTFWSIPPLLFCLAFIKLRSKAFQALQYVKASIIFESILLPLLVLAGLLVSATTVVTQALLLYISAAFLVVVLGTFGLWYAQPEQSRRVVPQFKTKYWMQIALPMVIGGVSQLVMNRSDILVLGMYGNMGGVGLYSAAMRFARLNTFILEAINTVAPAMISTAFQAGDINKYKSLIHTAMLWSTCASIPLLLVMILWPEALMGLFGDEFTSGATLLQILAIGQFINALTGPVGFTLLVTGQERFFARATTITAICNLVGNLLVVPIWGAIGAATVTALSTAANNIVMYLQIRKSMNAVVFHSPQT